MVVKRPPCWACGSNLLGALGRRVRELRHEKGISQEALAERAALHRNYVGSVERGERDIGVTATSQLARALGLSLAEFFAPFRQH